MPWISLWVISSFPVIIFCRRGLHKKLRILVGLDVDTNISKSIQVINTLSENKLSLGQLRERYYQEFVHLFNNSDFLDSEEKQKSFTLFYNKIKDGSL